MIKMISMMKRKDGVSLDRFREWMVNEHVVHARRIPGLRHYRVNVALSDVPDAPYDCVTELYFDSEEAMAEAFATEAGKAAGADAAPYAGSRSKIVCRETVQF